MFFKIYFMYSILDDENMLLRCVFLESLSSRKLVAGF